MTEQRRLCLPKYKRRISQNLIYELRFLIEIHLDSGVQNIIQTPGVGYYRQPFQDVKSSIISDLKQKFKRSYKWVLRERNI